MQAKVKVVLIHPFCTVIAGLRAVLGSSFEVLEETASGVEYGISLIERFRPDVALIGDKLEQGLGVDLLEMIRERNIVLKTILLGDMGVLSHAAKAYSRGAANYLNLGCHSSEILAAVRSASTDGKGAEGTPYHKVICELQSKEKILNLTPRQSQVARCVAMGLSNRDIADCLRISVETVKEHVQSIMRSLGMRDRTCVAVWIHRKRLVL